jgi:hypothetical protein
MPHDRLVNMNAGQNVRSIEHRGIDYCARGDTRPRSLAV